MNKNYFFSLAGMSRSVTVAVAYIMSTTNLSWKEALKVVRVGRSIANPNVGFQQQLKDFESSRLQDVSNKQTECFFKFVATKNSDCTHSTFFSFSLSIPFEIQCNVLFFP